MEDIIAAGNVNTGEKLLVCVYVGVCVCLTEAVHCRSSPFIAHRCGNIFTFTGQ